MTPFASVGLYRRASAVVFKPPRKEHQNDISQARKAAIRHWRSAASDTDELLRVIVVREFGGRLEVSERTNSTGREQPWIEYRADLADAAREPHLAACMRELGIDPNAVPPPVPDVLIINGHTYRRDL